MLTIRKAAAPDLPKILEIYANARRFMAENGNLTQWTGGYPQEAVIRNDLTLGHLYVCTDADAVLGVFCFFEGVEPDYSEIFDGAWLAEGPYGVVHRIAVASGNRGVASACLEFAFSKCENLRIDTHRDNIPMQKLLAKNGFHRCGTIHCHHGGDRIAYQKI